MERLIPPPDTWGDEITYHLDVDHAEGVAQRLFGPRYGGMFIDRSTVAAGVLTVLVVTHDLAADQASLEAALGGPSPWFTVAATAFTEEEQHAELKRISDLLQEAGVIGSAVSLRVVDQQFIVVAEIPEAEVELRRAIREGVLTLGITTIRPGIVPPTPA